METDPTEKNAAAQALGRLGGAANTPAQQRARKRNAKLAGRPGRVCLHCGEPVAGGHVERALDESCGQHGWRWQQGANGKPTATGATATLDAIATELRRGRNRDDQDTIRAIADLVRASGRRL